MAEVAAEAVGAVGEGSLRSSSNPRRNSSSTTSRTRRQVGSHHSCSRTMGRCSTRVDPLLARRQQPRRPRAVAEVAAEDGVVDAVAAGVVDVAQVGRRG